MKADSDAAAAGNAESERTRMFLLDFLYIALSIFYLLPGLCIIYTIQITGLRKAIMDEANFRSLSLSLYLHLFIQIKSRLFPFSVIFCKRSPRSEMSDDLSFKLQYTACQGVWLALGQPTLTTVRFTGRLKPVKPEIRPQIRTKGPWLMQNTALMFDVGRQKELLALISSVI